jgi:hypothetical protein
MAALSKSENTRILYSRPEIRGIANLDALAREIQTLAVAAPDDDEIALGYFDDMQTSDRLLEPFQLAPTIIAYAGVSIFAALYSLEWFVVRRAA